MLGRTDEECKSLMAIGDAERKLLVACGKPCSGAPS
jgi:hypothetical protein